MRPASSSIAALGLYTLSCWSMAGHAAPLQVTTGDPVITAQTLLQATDVGGFIDLFATGAPVTAATGAAFAAGLVGTGTADVGFTFDPADPTGTAAASFAPPFAAVDPGYLFLFTLDAVGSAAGTIELLFDNDVPSPGSADFGAQVLLRIAFEGVTGDPFLALVDAVGSGGGFAGDLAVTLQFANVASGATASVPLPATLSLLAAALAALAATTAQRSRNARVRKSDIGRTR